ncbi:Virulence-associated A [Gossypium arboreum]|uniref:Virulence-associated A n=1 Tax=Gossypium arboreum TaxID=29729 RepID=A0A0B0NZY6_GOSAR|nr:Virulence-associated A [Gossypium arboreum]
MNNIDFYLSSPGMSPAIKLHRFFPSSSVEFWLRSTPG